jgi:hypothetical protein
MRAACEWMKKLCSNKYSHLLQKPHIKGCFFLDLGLELKTFSTSQYRII